MGASIPVRAGDRPRGAWYLEAMPGLDPICDYPLGVKRPDLIRTPSGSALTDLTLERLRTGELTEEDLRTAPETLRMQGLIARAAGRERLAENLERAAELTAVPDDVILEVYSALRPGRSTADGLERWARRLEDEYAASATAAFVREAATAYRERGLLS